VSEAQVLARLHDIQLPAPISWWPMAPGWYFLLLLGLLLSLFFLYKMRRFYVNGFAKRQAFQLLKCYEQEYQSDPNSQVMCMKVSELLRRVALVYFPRMQVASLQGDAWLDFLCRTSKGIDFRSCRAYLLELPYQPAELIRPIDLKPLFYCVKAWIKQRGAPCLN